MRTDRWTADALTLTGASVPELIRWAGSTEGLIASACTAGLMPGIAFVNTSVFMASFTLTYTARMV